MTDIEELGRRVAEAGHTPGPWRSQGWVPTWAYIPIHDASHNLVASMYPDSGHKYTREQVEANARLIAAAPDLLAALRDLLGIAEGEGIVGDSTTIAAARAAIAKAEGNAISSIRPNGGAEE